MNPVRGSHCTWEEGEGSAMPVGIPVTVALRIFCVPRSPGAGLGRGLGVGR